MQYFHSFSPHLLTAPAPPGTRNHPHESHPKPAFGRRGDPTAWQGSAISFVLADSGLQLDLEIALSGVPAKPDGPSFSPAERCVEASGDVIKFLLAIRKSEVKVYFTYFTWRRIQQCRTRLPQRLRRYGMTYPSTSAMPAVLFFPRTITV